MSIRTALVNKDRALHVNKDPACQQKQRSSIKDRTRKRFLIDDHGLYWHMRSDQALKQVYSKIGVGIDVDNRNKEWTEFQVG